MCNLKEECGFCKQLVKTNSSSWARGYGTVHKACYNIIKEREKKIVLG
jgi:hypothetical protein